MPSGFTVKLGGALQLKSPDAGDGTPTGRTPAEFGLGMRAKHHGWGEKGTQGSNTTPGATSQEGRGGWIHHAVRSGEMDATTGNKLPAFPAAASRAGKVAVPTAADPYTGNAPIGGVLFGVEKPIIDPVGAPFQALHARSVFGDVITSSDKDGKGGCGCGGR